MAKKRPRSILQRAAATESRPAKKARAQQAAGSGHAGQQAATAGAARKQQQGSGKSGGGGGGGGAREPAGLRAVSAVHSQAAYAVRRLLEADASKRGGVSLKSLTLGPRVTAKKVRLQRRAAVNACGLPASAPP